jgi:hypothetical protein
VTQAEGAEEGEACGEQEPGCHGFMWEALKLPRVFGGLGMRHESEYCSE